MSLPRFHIPPDRWDLGNLTLAGEEARHCAQVMRRGVGDEIAAFNGAGEWARCRITGISKGRVELSQEAAGVTPKPQANLALLQAIPKAGNMELIIQKAVELGVNAIHAVFTARTIVKLDSRET